MTGFGRAVFNSESFDMSLDISSVNRKGLEVTVNLPREWQQMENLIAARVKKFFTRGKVSLSFKVNFKTGGSAFILNESRLGDALKTFKETCKNLGLEFVANSETLLQINSMLPREQAEDFDADVCWGQIEGALTEALQAIDKMRSIEGDNLAEDFKARLSLMQTYIASIVGLSKNTVQNYKENLLQRLKTLNLELDLNDERLLKEISIFADKCDIAEELTRLSSHISQFDGLLKLDETNGRKMDFLCQEIGREINTIGSKANNLDITKNVIELKNELERIREQTQNLE